jgi:hypothetical protein
MRMNAYGSTGLFGMLVVTSLVSGAAAMEINQQRAPSTGDAPAFTLPAFLDGDRLPDLQDAWRAHFGDQSDAAVARPASEAVAPQPDISQQTTTTRGEQTSREAAAVRTRAEELSSRFGAGAESADGGTTASEAGPPAETASVNAGADAAEPGQPVVEQVLAPAEDGVVSEVVAPSDDAPVIEDMGAKPAKGVKRSTTPVPRQPVQTATRTAPAPAALIKVDPAAPQPESDPMMPTEIRAFGWNAQP